MNINKILKNYDAEDKEAFKTDFKLWLKYLNKTFGWDISNITLKNCEEKIPILFYNEIIKLLKLDRDIDCFFTEEHKYSDILTDKRKKKYEQCLNEEFTLLVKEFDVEYEKLKILFYQILDDTNEVMRYVFYNDIPLLIENYEIDIDQCFTNLIEYYQEDPDMVLAITLIDDILYDEPEDYKELCSLIYKTIKSFYSQEEYNNILKQLKEQ